MIFLIGCNNSAVNNKTETDKNMNSPQNDNKRVTGIGGIFFKTNDTKKTKQWFSENIGITTDEYGAMFEFRLSENPDMIGYLQWSPFSEKTTYFQPSEKDFMINYRVDNLELLLSELKKNNVTILDSIESYEYGKFLHIIDIENNKIELWEPVDSVFTTSTPNTTNQKTGIGGIFFKSKDPKKLKQWYKDNLGFNVDEHGCMFEFRNAIVPGEINVLRWCPFPDSTEYFSPSEKQFMINYRVENLEELVTKLITNGVTILDPIEYTDYGKFIHIMGPDNTKIELWEH